MFINRILKQFGDISGYKRRRQHFSSVFTHLGVKASCSYEDFNFEIYQIAPNKSLLDDLWLEVNEHYQVNNTIALIHIFLTEGWFKQLNSYIKDCPPHSNRAHLGQPPHGPAPSWALPPPGPAPTWARPHLGPPTSAGVRTGPGPCFIIERHKKNPKRPQRDTNV